VDLFRTEQQIIIRFILLRGDKRGLSALLMSTTAFDLLTLCMYDFSGKKYIGYKIDM
jgi:hypothetical protein